MLIDETVLAVDCLNYLLQAELDWHIITWIGARKRKFEF